jgi:hypothetical protein
MGPLKEVAQLAYIWIEAVKPAEILQPVTRKFMLYYAFCKMAEFSRAESMENSRGSFPV